ncbi:hypothetical protein C8F01DRAFT_1124159 [Mycena amicta]|nr:hypothetical protein C8F01DRAFT_1124159 [Mycena amicta]
MRAHHIYVVFERRWQLPVYFQCAGIVGKMEEALVNPRVELSPANNKHSLVSVQAAAVCCCYSAVPTSSFSMFCLPQNPLAGLYSFLVSLPAILHLRLTRFFAIRSVTATTTWVLRKACSNNAESVANATVVSCFRAEALFYTCTDFLRSRTYLPDILMLILVIFGRWDASVLPLGLKTSPQLTSSARSNAMVDEQGWSVCNMLGWLLPARAKYLASQSYNKDDDRCRIDIWTRIDQHGHTGSKDCITSIAEGQCTQLCTVRCRW